MNRLIVKLLNGYQPGREPSLAWLPAYTPRKSRKRRAKHFHIPLSPSRQLVISLQISHGRLEVRPRRPASGVLSVRSLRRQLAPSLLLILVGVAGGLYFSFHLQGSVRLYPNESSVSNPSGLTLQPNAVSPTALDSHAKPAIRINLASARFGYAAADKPVSSADQPKVIVTPSKTMPKALPVRLRISKIEIDTSVTPVDLRPSGSIALPDSFEEVGWYDKGPTPGELGPAVIVGHVDSTHGIAIFWRLRELVPGDTFQIDRADGTTATFKVLIVNQFSQATFPTEDVYGNIRYAGIRLITCGGTFSTATGHYDQNTVVYAALE